MACPTIFPASSFFPSPSFKERLAEAPFPIKLAKALNIIMSGNKTLVAPFPNVPTPFPIKI